MCMTVVYIEELLWADVGEDLAECVELLKAIDVQFGAKFENQKSSIN